MRVPWELKWYQTHREFLPGLVCLVYGCWVSVGFDVLSNVVTGLIDGTTSSKTHILKCSSKIGVIPGVVDCAVTAGV